MKKIMGLIFLVSIASIHAMDQQETEKQLVSAIITFCDNKESIIVATNFHFSGDFIFKKIVTKNLLNNSYSYFSQTIYDNYTNNFDDDQYRAATNEELEKEIEDFEKNL